MKVNGFECAYGSCSRNDTVDKYTWTRESLNKPMEVVEVNCFYQTIKTYSFDHEENVEVPVEIDGFTLMKIFTATMTLYITNLRKTPIVSDTDELYSNIMEAINYYKDGDDKKEEIINGANDTEH